tara:strand:+ start:1539 stop:2024 length:486 start_codon:yes stop_codon:yes gene_type:complete
MNSYNVIIENILDNNSQNNTYIPDDENIHRWISITLESHDKNLNTELGLRITNNTEINNLNKTYRHKDKPTNVLAFPFEIPENLPEEIQQEYLGDIVCSAEYINQEAKEQNKQNIHHWAHIIIHGTLHLLGYDHINNSDAEIMEQKEIDILHLLNYPNPYL